MPLLCDRNRALGKRRMWMSGSSWKRTGYRTNWPRNKIPPWWAAKFDGASRFHSAGKPQKNL